MGTAKCIQESLLKKLDGHIRVIPILDENRRLISVVTRDFFPIQAEKKVYARARAPVRISFGGGGSDLTHYFSNEAGLLLMQQFLYIAMPL
jgi:D-glycero-alpha-D-manno-heptose-7-phosphate kinase